MVAFSCSRLSTMARGAFAAITFLCVSIPAAWAQDQPSDAVSEFIDGVKLYFDDPGWMLRYLVANGYLQRRVGLLLAAGLIGFAIGVLRSPWARPYLLRFGKVVFRVLVALLILIGLFGAPPVADYVVYLLAAAVFFIASSIAKKFGRQPPVWRRPTSFGSAKWADYSHLQTNGVIGSEGFTLGDFRSGDIAHPLQYRGARHLLTVAPTRSGKGISSIIPNLLTYTGSAVIIDPKGENAMITAYRRGLGSQKHNIPGMRQTVFLVDPWDIAASNLNMPRARFNPLNWIKSGDPDAAENAFLLADAIVPVGDEGESRFWDEEAKALLTGLILYVATAPAEAERRHLGRVRDLLVQTDDELKETLTEMYNHPHAVVSTTAARTASKDPKLRSSVLASAQSHTHFLDSPRIRESLEQTDFKFEDLKTTRMSIYLILPADRLKTFDRWLRLLVQQAITVNARNIDKKPDKPILFLLDEMSAIGALRVSNRRSA